MERRRRWIIGLLVGVAAVAATVGVAIGRSGGQRRVGPGVLPLVRGANVTRTFTDCSEVGLASYVPNRPCDTYFLATGDRYGSSVALLAVERRRLAAAGWRRAHATTWGQTLGAYGWIGPHHVGCAVVHTARVGSAAQAQLEASTTMPAAFVAFGRTAGRATRTPTLWVILQPGYDQYGQPSC